MCAQSLQRRRVLQRWSRSPACRSNINGERKKNLPPWRGITTLDGLAVPKRIIAERFLTKRRQYSVCLNYGAMQRPVHQQLLDPKAPILTADT